LRPLLDPFNRKVKHNFVILIKCIKKNESGEACLRYLSFAFDAPPQSHTLLNLRRRQRGAGIGERRLGAIQDAQFKILRIAGYALAHPRFATGPTPSLRVMSRLAGICLKVSCRPLGQYTSMSAKVEFPKPKCNRESLDEKKLD
jgi:hypothetical protein